MQSSSGVVEHEVCREQIELDAGSRTPLAVLVWEPRGRGAALVNEPAKNLPAQAEDRGDAGLIPG